MDGTPLPETKIQQGKEILKTPQRILSNDTTFLQWQAGPASFSQPKSPTFRLDKSPPIALTINYRSIRA